MIGRACQVVPLSWLHSLFNLTRDDITQFRLILLLLRMLIQEIVKLQTHVLFH